MSEAWAQPGRISWGVTAWTDSGETGNWVRPATVPGWARQWWEETEMSCGSQWLSHHPRQGLMHLPGPRFGPFPRVAHWRALSLTPRMHMKALLNSPGHLCDSCSKTQMKERLPFYNKKVGGEERDFMTGFFFLFEKEHNPCFKEQGFSTYWSN